MRISDGSSDVCSSDLLGSVAGDIALIQGASAVVIAGGLGARLVNHLPHSGFAERFAAKGRFETMLRDMRSEERSVGKECVSTCRSRWSPSPLNDKTIIRIITMMTSVNERHNQT